MEPVNEFERLKAEHLAARARLAALDASPEREQARAEAYAKSNLFYAAERAEFARQICERLVGQTIVEVSPTLGRRPVNAMSEQELEEGVEIVLANGVCIRATTTSDDDDARLEISFAEPV